MEYGFKFLVVVVGMVGAAFVYVEQGIFGLVAKSYADQRFVICPIVVQSPSCNRIARFGFPFGFARPIYIFGIDKIPRIWEKARKGLRC